MRQFIVAKRYNNNSTYIQLISYMSVYLIVIQVGPIIGFHLLLKDYE